MRHRIVFFAVLLALASFSGATIFNVDSTLDEIDASSGDGDCISTPSGVCTLRAAIMQANVAADQDTINVPAGVYTLSIPGTGEEAAEQGDLDLRTSVTIIGDGMHTTIIDAAVLDRVFELTGDSVIIQDLTIRNGSAITASSFVGGGVYHRGNNLWLTRVRLTANRANAGGGLKISQGSTAIIQECAIDGNSLTPPDFTNSNGAAIHNDRGSLSLVWSTVTNNSNEGSGTAVVTVGNCASTVAIHNSTIAHNGFDGIDSWNCSLALRNTTIAENTGTGLNFGVYTGLSFELNAANSVLSGNSSADCNLDSGTTFLQYSLDSDDSCGMLLANGNIPATNPLLLPLRNWGGATDTMYPQPDVSPLIDSGLDGSNCLGQDQRFMTRPADGDGDGSAICDMGAVEAGDLILWAGFEDGTSDEWTAP